MKDLSPWFILKYVPGVGNYIFKRLIDRFDCPESVLKASTDALLNVEGVTGRLVSAIRSAKADDFIKQELDAAKRQKVHIVTMKDNAYPSLLLQIPDPPPMLYVYGMLDNSRHHMAVVGTRAATAYGTSVTMRLCRDLAARKFAVVSGMARGIDTAAHKGAIEGEGKTIAVLGGGHCKIYPAENKELYHTIAKNGAVISEFPMMAEPRAQNFPLRNRIICGMSLGTVVVEAAKRSGSLITARLAAEQGREVFAVPGSVKSSKSTGTHSLLKQGAKLVEKVEDIMEEMPSYIFGNENRHKDKNIFPAGMKILIEPAEEKVLAVLEPYPVHIDIVARKTGLEAGKLSGLLLNLELKGMIYQSPGKLFSTREVT